MKKILPCLMLSITSIAATAETITSNLQNLSAADVKVHYQYCTDASNAVGAKFVCGPTVTQMIPGNKTITISYQTEGDKPALLNVLSADATAAHSDYPIAPYIQGATMTVCSSLAQKYNGLLSFNPVQDKVFCNTFS